MFTIRTCNGSCAHRGLGNSHSKPKRQFAQGGLPSLQGLRYYMDMSKIIKKFIPKILPLLASLATLGAVVYFVEPPKSWPQATTTQILFFFLPLLASLTFLADIFLSYLPRSFAIGLGGMVLVVLLSVEALNPLTAISTLLICIAVIRFTPKPRLTKETKIHKLTRLGDKKR